MQGPSLCGAKVAAVAAGGGGGDGRTRAGNGHAAAGAAGEWVESYVVLL